MWIIQLVRQLLLEELQLVAILTFLVEMVTEYMVVQVLMNPACLLGVLHIGAEAEQVDQSIMVIMIRKTEKMVGLMDQEVEQGDMNHLIMQLEEQEQMEL